MGASCLNCTDELKIIDSAVCRQYSHHQEGSGILPRKGKEHLATFQSKTVGYSTTLNICDTDEVLFLHQLTTSGALPLQFHLSRYHMTTTLC